MTQEETPGVSDYSCGMDPDVKTLEETLHSNYNSEKSLDDMDDMDVGSGPPCLTLLKYRRTLLNR